MEPASPRPDPDSKAHAIRPAHAPAQTQPPGGATPPIAYRTITPADIPAATRLLNDLGGVTMAGLFGRSLEHAFCREALRDGPFRLIVADRGGDLLGFVLAVIDPAPSYRAFLKRHPLLAARLLWRRALSRPSRQRAPLPEPDPKAPASSWNRAGAHSARIITISVAETARGLGIGTGLYRALFDDLAPRGVVEVLARIVPGNTPSLQLHRRTGWNLNDLGHTLEATRDPRTAEDRPAS